MSLIRYAASGNLSRFNDKISLVSKKEGKSKLYILFKFLYCFFSIKCGYSDYLNYKLYNKTRKEIKEYVSIGDQDKFYAIVSPAKHKDFFSIKPNFLRNFKDFIGRDFFDPEMSKNELKIFLNKHKVFIAKPYNGIGGHGVVKMNSSDVDVDSFYDKVVNDKLLLEELVVQHDDISQLCSPSVNTLRIMTFVNKGKSRIIFAAMRIGNGINNVDNFHQGGMGALIDIEKGILVGNAFDKELNEFSNHPTSNIKFDGFKIPNWDYVKDMVNRAALVNENIQVVGWDVAVTKDGATFIEGNRRAGWDLIQVLYDRGRKDIIRSILSEINETNGTNYKI